MKKRIFVSMLPAMGAAAAVCVAAAALLTALHVSPWIALPAAGLFGFAASAAAALRAAEQNARDAQREQERLRYERDRLANTLDCLAEGILVLDTAANVRYANTAACTALYADRQALLGNPFSIAAAAAPLRANVAAALERGEPGSVDLPLPDGRTARASVFPLAAGGAAGGALIVILDVTAERESAGVRRQFFASAEEILRTPTQNIKGFAELLASDMPLGGNKQQEISKRMLREVAGLNQLIGKLIVLSRMENGDLSFSRVQLDLADVANSCCDSAAQRAQQLGVTLSRSLVPCPLFASLWEMGELISSLLDNALRYNRAGGRVAVSLTIENNAPCLRVTNTGDPIPPEQARRIFERFYRIGRGKSPGSAGLGLAIVKHIAGNYGAIVTVTPQPDGNTFTVRFPRPDTQRGKALNPSDK